MFQFKPYPIYVVYSRQNQKDAQPQISQYYRDKEYEWQKYVTNVGITTEDTDPRSLPFARKYEADIRDRLKRIDGTEIGRTLFKQLKSDVWIVPRIGGCYCAQTYPLDYETKQLDYSIGKGDTYVWFDPNKDFEDDTLFHEFIHAYRYGFNKFERRAFANNEYNTEEFLAHTMQNIYLSSRKKPLLFTYNAGSVDGHPSEIGYMGSIYQHFLENPEFVMVLRYFLDHEYFAMLVSNMKSAQFNPFRDYKILERMYLERLGDPTIKSLPKF
jgi:hypothetical protein